jgi:ZIP family zinc transporter
LTQTIALLPPVLQALVAGLVTLLLTAAGAALVAVGRLSRGALFDAMLGFASGVMLAAAYWSLLEPAIAIAAARGDTPWLPVAAGLLAGAVFLGLPDRLLPHCTPHSRSRPRRACRPGGRRRRCSSWPSPCTISPKAWRLAWRSGLPRAAPASMPGMPSFGAAVALALGIALQNVPQGAAVALPLREAGASRWRRDWWTPFFPTHSPSRRAP